jgi:hypothetical protein
VYVREFLTHSEYDRNKWKISNDKTRRIFENGIPDTFVKLCLERLPRPIHNKVEHENALEVLRALAGLDLNPDQADYFEALSIIVNDYEVKNIKNMLTTRRQPPVFAHLPAKTQPPCGNCRHSASDIAWSFARAFNCNSRSAATVRLMASATSLSRLADWD